MNQKFRRRSIRLKDYDYSRAGAYFVTICVDNHDCVFGNIQGENMVLNELGNKVQQFWEQIPEHNENVILDEFVIMPNHIHGILLINKPNYDDWRPNKFGPQSNNLGSVVRGYKAGVKKYATINRIEFEWQPRYHDSIIRTENALRNIRQYIIDNPMKWEQDRNNIENLMM